MEIQRSERETIFVRKRKVFQAFTPEGEEADNKTKHNKTEGNRERKKPWNIRKSP